MRVLLRCSPPGPGLEPAADTLTEKGRGHLTCAGGTVFPKDRLRMRDVTRLHTDMRQYGGIESPSAAR